MSIIVRALDSTRKQPTIIGKASLEIGRVIKKEFISIYKSDAGSQTWDHVSNPYAKRGQSLPLRKIRCVTILSLPVS